MKDNFVWLEPVFVTYDQFTAALLAYLPTLAAALLVLGFGFLAAWTLKRAVLRISLGTAALTRRLAGPRDFTFGRLPWPLSTIIATLVYWLAVVFFLAVSASILGLPGIASWIAAAAGVLPRLLAAALIMLAGYSVAGMAREAIYRVTRDEGHEHRFLGQAAFLLVNLIAIVVGTGQLGIDLSLLQSLILLVTGAVVGGIALAFGLGAGSSIDNVIAGYYVRNTYRRGQRIRIGTSEGEILDIKPTAVLIDSQSGRALVPAKLFQQQVSVLLDSEDDK